MQTWNNLLDYIKLNFGASLNFLEFSDEQLIEYIKTQVIPYFSQYSGLKKYVIITEEHQLVTEVGAPYRYKLPIENEPIYDVVDVYYDTTGDGSSIYADIPATGYFDSINKVIDNSFVDAIKSVNARQTWSFVPPHYMEFDFKVYRACIVYTTNHEDLSTIRPDLYEIIFKDLCLGYCQVWVASLRRQFNSVSTALGQIEIDWQELKQEGQQNIQEAQQKLLALPPDHFVWIE